MTDTPPAAGRLPTGLTDDQLYVLGLLVEEPAELSKLVAKAMRFGLYDRGPPGPPYHGCNSHELMPIEAGDCLAAIRFAVLAGLFDMGDVEKCAQAKLEKLLDPTAVDNNGRRLAPSPFGIFRNV